MSRTARLALAAGALAAFVVISAVLARVLSAGGAERAAVLALLRDEARGEATTAAAHVAGCTGASACRARLRATASRLRRPGPVQILAYSPAVGFSPAGARGVARVAWRTAARRDPVVQCVAVRRSGNALTGLRIELTAVSPRLPSQASCPKRL